MDTLDVRGIRIDSASGTPPFEQVRAQIARQIASGELAQGTRLPTVRQLASDLGVAAATAARVYRELESDGLVTTSGRRGTSVASPVTDPGTGMTSQSDIATEALESASAFTRRARQLGLSRAEAHQLLDRSWDGG